MTYWRSISRHTVTICENVYTPRAIYRNDFVISHLACQVHVRRLQYRKGGDMEEWPMDLRVREFPR